MNSQPVSSHGVVVLIPARGGSRRLPGKNLRIIGGLPLIVHSINHAKGARSVAEICVSTDSPDIERVAREAGARVIRRPAELAGDEATTESALLHALDERLTSGLADPQLAVLLQCTSPVRLPSDIDRAIALLISSGADSLLSVTENKRFIWRETEAGLLPFNYDFRRRPREQELAPQYMENGSIYAFRTELLRRTGNRLGGRIAAYEMDYWSSFQIDSQEDAELVEWILQRRGHQASGQ